MRKIFLLVVLVSIYHLKSFSQGQLNSSEIEENLEKLNVVGSVLYIAAHPDDENTRLLTYLSKERKFRTGYLSITRGDGGQNLVGKEQAEMLGLIRTQELIAARKIDGAEQFFTRANDFGYSKNPEETFRFWNKDSVLYDVVWVIRNFKPDVVICRFPTTGEGGHGHHTASAILAVEAFTAAADPKMFPQQLKYVSTWQIKRVVWNKFNPAPNAPVEPGLLKIDVGVFNPVTGKGVGEIAADSRTMHKSQGFGATKTRGTSIEYFKHMKGDSAKEDIFEGIDFSWNRIKSPSISKNINDCISAYNFKNPAGSVDKLIDLYKNIQQLNDKDEYTKYWKNKKLKEVESLLINCSGLWIEAVANNSYGIPGGKTEFTIQIINRSNAEIKINKISWTMNQDTATSLTLKPNELYTFKHIQNLPKEIPYSNPYWLNKSHDDGFYSVDDETIIGKVENDPAFSIIFDTDISGSNLKISRPVIHKNTDPTKGEVYRPFEILPAATINFNSKSFMFTNQQPRKIQMQVKSNSDSLTGKIKINLPQGWKAEPEEFNGISMRKDEELSFETTITPSKNAAQGEILASIISGTNEISKSIRSVDYDHIPSQFMLTDAKAKLVNLNVTRTGSNIGYIPGAGDEVADCLTQLGYNVTILSREMLEKTNLSQYDAIIMGIRAFNTNEWLQDFDKKLLSYVRGGGNLVVQYNTNSRVGPLTAKIFPYPFTISRDRVTEENASVRFINPDHPVLNTPNKISEADFSNWVQERGIYFASEVDSTYDKIFSMNDTGDKSSEGSLIVGKYGKGNFVYTGIAFFRQLPAGVPGAYRLLVNLLSIPKNE